LLNKIEGVEQVVSTQENPVLLVRKDGDLYSGLLNLETLEMASLNVIKVP